MCSAVAASMRTWTLLRTILDTNLGLLALTRDRRGTIAVNQADRASIRSAASRAVALALASESDPANEIAEYQPPGEFANGAEQPDTGLMFDRLRDSAVGSVRRRDHIEHVRKRR